MSWRSEKKIYLDYAASTPLDERVLSAMEPYFLESFGNTGSLHSFGQEALRAVDESREKLAGLIGAEYKDIIFTGSATEANNLVLRGAFGAYRETREGRPRMITSAIEHESILETARDLEREGVEVVYLPVDGEGVVDLEKLKEALNDNTILVSVMYVNNQIGTIQPIAEISRIIDDFRKSKGDSEYPLFHSDAVQAFQYLDCDVNSLGVNMMTLSAHKIYGPKGVGALYLRRANEANKLTKLKAIITGGGQEFGLRSATPNTPGIVGFAEAARLISEVKESEAKRISRVKEFFWQKIKENFPDARKNGRGDAPHILNVGFLGHSSQDLLIKFDMAGMAVASGAACATRSSKFSHVLSAIGLKPGEAGIIRFVLGKFVTEKEIEEAIQRMKEIL